MARAISKRFPRESSRLSGVSLEGARPGKWLALMGENGPAGKEHAHEGARWCALGRPGTRAKIRIDGAPVALDGALRAGPKRPWGIALIHQELMLGAQPRYLLPIYFLGNEQKRSLPPPRSTAAKNEPACSGAARAHRFLALPPDHQPVPRR